jgi:plastocyanin
VYVYASVIRAASLVGALVALGTLLAATNSSAGAAQAVTPKTKLVLTTGPDFDITLRTAEGKAVKQLKKGTYTVTVRDRSTFHNAHVTAPGYNRATTLPETGTKTWKVKLAQVGTFRYVCDPHIGSGMRGSAKIIG